MSSYLNFYLRPKGKDEKLLLTSFSRSSLVYDTFSNINPVYMGIGEETNYKEVTKEDINYLLRDVSADIEKYKEKLCLYEKSTIYTPKMVEDIISLKEMLQDAVESKAYLYSFRDIIETTGYGENDFDGLYCNIG